MKFHQNKSGLTSECVDASQIRLAKRKGWRSNVDGINSQFRGILKMMRRIFIDPKVNSFIAKKIIT